MTVKSVSNKDCRALVQRRKLFKGSNLFSEEHGDLYVVYSYGPHHPLFVHDGMGWYHNTDKYSASTTRHKSQADPRLPSLPKTTEELREMVEAAQVAA